MSWFGLRKKRDAERDFMERVFVHWDAMYRYAFRLAGTEAEAQDLVQDAMAKALKNFDRVRPDTNWRAWVFTIVRNAFISRMRKLGRESLVDDADKIAADAERSLDRPVGSALDALGGDQRFREGFEDEVLHALQALPEAQRTAVVLCDIEGLEYEEIAQVLDCPVGTVRSRIHHARKRLKAALVDYARARGFGHAETA
ncbi:MAG: sigma-70 family RNA polymerase sigma factor [Deltaproteobacteria bacterium]|nr:sigma-70 family RNA polymerase sigma factor [Deltaproteobacteria bacterium]